jgi:pyridoxamine 5'-phosphate oxidase
MRDRLRGLPAIAGTPPEFDPSVVPGDPITLFLTWFDAAVAGGAAEPHTMTVSTVDADGHPDARVVILKDLEDGAWVFASSLNSAKGAQLVAHPDAALTFWWPAVARSVRLRGPVAMAPLDENAADFSRRSPGARAMIAAGRQSAPFDDVAERDRLIDAAEARIDDEPSFVDPGWRVWKLRPTTIEFWQGSPDRRHARVQYSRVDGGWVCTLLWP